MSGDREAVLAEARTFIEDKTDKFARFYVSVMEKIQDKGDSYVADELARIGRVLGKPLGFISTRSDFAL